MNDADIVVCFCSELFQCKHAVPTTLASAAASSMCGSIKNYFGIKSKAEYDRKYRGLEMLDEGVRNTFTVFNTILITDGTPINSNIKIKYCWEYYYSEALENDIQTSTRCHLMFAFCKGSIFLFWFICNYESMTPSGSKLAENEMQQCLSERRQKSLNENNDYNFQ